MNLNPFARKQEAVSIQRPCYAIATREGSSAEITMYGQIVENRPRDFWTDTELPGNYIVKSEFLEDLKAVENVRKLTIRLDSLGGDAYASLLIYNRLRELKAKKIIQVDGVAMSGGSIIMCAGDTVKVNPGSLIMVHKSMALLWGFYNTNDLDKVRGSNDAVDKALAKAYSKKAGITEDEALEMMAQETYMTGDEAVGKGFADELVKNEDAPSIAASADHNTLFVNGRTLAAMGYSLPESIPVAAPQAEEVTTTQQAAPEAGKGGDTTMASNLEELRNENPQLAETLMAQAKSEVANQAAEAAEAERRRLQEIDSIASVYDGDLVNDAKYGAPCTAQEMAFRAAQKAAQSGKAFLQDLEADGKASGAGSVPAAAADTELPSEKPLSPKERAKQGAQIAKAAVGK